MIEDIYLGEGVVAVNFDGRTVTFVFGELDTLVSAYAATTRVTGRNIAWLSSR